MEKCTFCGREKNKVDGLMKSKYDNIYICDSCVSEIMGVFNICSAVLWEIWPDWELKGMMRGIIFVRDEEPGAWKKRVKRRPDFRYKIKGSLYFKDPWTFVQEKCAFCRGNRNEADGLIKSSVKDDVYICKFCAITVHNLLNIPL